MGKGHINRVNNRPAAQSHTAHKFDAPKHGKTWEGFKVKPAKPEVVPIYSTTPKINLNTPTGKILGAALLFAAAGSIIKVADAQCVNPRPVPHSFRNGLGTTTTVNCADSDLFYGPQVQEYRPSSRSFTIYHAQNRIISEYICRDPWQWGWASDCSTTYRAVSEAVGTPRYESIVIMDGVSRQICRNNGNVDKFRGTDDQSAALRSKSLASVTNFAAICNDAASRCAQISTYVCQTPSVTPTPSPSPSSSEVQTTSVTESSTVLLTPSQTASKSALEPSPTYSAEDQPTNPAIILNEPDPTGPAAGATTAFLTVAGVVGAGIVVGTIIKKRTNQASSDAPAPAAQAELGKVPETIGPTII